MISIMELFRPKVFNTSAVNLAKNDKPARSNLLKPNDINIIRQKAIRRNAPKPMFSPSRRSSVIPSIPKKLV